MATEEETFRRLKRLPMSEELLDSVFTKGPIPIINMDEEDYIDTVRAIKLSGWNIWEFYQAINVYHGFGKHDGFSENEDYIIRLIETEKKLNFND